MIKTEQFINQLTKALVEKDVENVYRQLFQMGIPDSVITSPYGGDGMLKSKAENLIALLEFKYDYDFTSRKDTIKVLIQALYYLKKAESAGDILPSIVFVGDKNECFVIHLNSLQKYLDADIDWTIAPSSAGVKNPELTLEMFNDKEVNPFVFDVGKGFDFSEVVNKILDLNSNVVRLVRITEKNINNIFEYFVGKVLVTSKKLDTNAQVSLFINILTNPDENYIHPKKKNTLITPAGEITVKGAKFASFFSHFEREYKPSEKENLIAISDRLIEDETRRREGAFFTPTIWVDEAHKMITEQFGSDWKEKYVVWDCACGTGNLTRDYKFKELYCSTLVQEEIDMMIQNRINPEAVKFKYDFLQDVPEGVVTGFGGGWEEKLPEGLVKALDEGKPMIMLINPPYGTASNRDESSKKGVAFNQVNAEMKADKLGACSQQLYAQFMYKIARIKEHYSLADMNVAIFNKPNFLTAPTYKKFRSFWVSQFRMKKGMLFQASNFSDVSTQWGILFSIWKSGGYGKYMTWVQADVKEQVPVKGLGLNTIQTIGTKDFDNMDNNYPASKWVREETKNDRVSFKYVLCLKSSINIGNKIKTLPINAFGTFISDTNTVYQNSQGVVILNTRNSANQGSLPIIPENFRKVCSLFTARKTITGKYANWINDKDEYKRPNQTHDDYEQWNNDAIIYSLFHSASNQSSLRDITYKDKQWDIENEWFWMSIESIKGLANEHSNQAVYDDCKAKGKERHVCTLLKDLKLSDDASDLLVEANKLVEKSFKFREMMNEEHPEYHLNSWDAGWYQIVKILKEYLPDDLKEFRLGYKKLEDRLRSGVYQFGFLRM